MQTDVEAPPGAAGGPLTTVCGEVVGVNSSAGDVFSFALEAQYVRRRVELFLVRPRVVTDPPTLSVTQSDVVGGGCGSEFEVSSVGAPIGRVYSDGEMMAATIFYPPNDCLAAAAEFSGYFVAGSPWYDYWCTGERRVSTCSNSRIRAAFVFNGNASTSHYGGSLTLVANPGPFPPATAVTAPNLEGFHLCAIDVRFHDSRFGGDSVGYNIRDREFPC